MISSVSDYKFVTNDLDKIIIDGGIMPLRDNPYVIRGEDITYPMEVRARMQSALRHGAVDKVPFYRKIQEPSNYLFSAGGWTSLIPPGSWLMESLGKMNGDYFVTASSSYVLLKSMIPDITGPEYIDAIDDSGHTIDALKKTKSLYTAFSSYFRTPDEIPKLTGFPVLTAEPIRNMLYFVNSLRNFFFGRPSRKSEFYGMTRYANDDDAYWYRSNDSLTKKENWDNMTVTFGRPDRQECMQYIKNMSLYAYMSFNARKYLTRGIDQGSCAGGQIVKLADMEKIQGVDTIDQGLPQPYFKVVVQGSVLKSMFIDFLSGSPAGYQSDRYSGGVYLADCRIPWFVFVGSFSDDMFF